MRGDEWFLGERQVDVGAKAGQRDCNWEWNEHRRHRTLFK